MSSSSRPLCVSTGSDLGSIKPLKIRSQYGPALKERLFLEAIGLTAQSCLV
ncbi:hypothetical protein Plhal304r1_c065g0152911 [Plasmopara halstedii]